MARYETLVLIETEAATNGEAQEAVRAAIGDDPRVKSVTLVNTVEQRPVLVKALELEAAVAPSAELSATVSRA